MKSAELHLRAALANFWLSDLGQVTLLQFLFPHQNNDNNKISLPKVWWGLKWETACENISWSAKCSPNIIIIISVHSPLPLQGSLVYLQQCENVRGTNYKLQSKLLQVHRLCLSPLLNSMCSCFSIFASRCFISGTYLGAKKNEILQAPYVYWNEISLSNLWCLKPNLILFPDLIPMTL